MAPAATDLQFMREVNSAAVLTHLREHERMSVSDLADAIGLSRQAVTRSLTALQEGGLVELLPPTRNERRTGRPAQLARFKAEAGYVVGALIDPRQVRLAVADLHGRVVASSNVALTAEPEDRDSVAQLVQQTAGVLSEAGVAEADVHFVAVGTPGIVNPEAGVNLFVPSMPELSGDVVVRALGEHLACPIYLDNDVKLASEGERWHGVRRDDDSLVVVHWGERIGAGIMLRGSLYRGATNDAGDLGFLDLLVHADQVVPRPGLGRFEAWAGASALIGLATDALEWAGEDARHQELADAGEDDALEIVLAGVMHGDAIFTTALQQLARRFAPGLVAVRALLDPHVVVLTGPVARAGQPLLDAITAPLSDYPLELPELQISVLGDDAVVQGAVRHSLDELERNRYASIERKRAMSIVD